MTSTEVIPYTTADQMASTFQATINEVLSLSDQINEKMHALNSVFGVTGTENSFLWNVSFQGASSEWLVRREMKRTAWKRIINVLGLHKVMTPAQKPQALHGQQPSCPRWLASVPTPST